MMNSFNKYFLSGIKREGNNTTSTRWKESHFSVSSVPIYPLTYRNIYIFLSEPCVVTNVSKYKYCWPPGASWQLNHPTAFPLFPSHYENALCLLKYAFNFLNCHFLLQPWKRICTNVKAAFCCGKERFGLLQHHSTSKVHYQPFYECWSCLWPISHASPEWLGHRWPSCIRLVLIIFVK